MRILIHNGKSGNDFYSIQYGSKDAVEMFIRNWRNTEGICFQSQEDVDYLNGMALLLGIETMFKYEHHFGQWFLELSQ